MNDTLLARRINRQLSLLGDNLGGFIVSWDKCEVEVFTRLNDALSVYKNAREHCDTGPYITAMSKKEMIDFVGDDYVDKY